ncbi:hypothetical protein Poly21_20640 [Allorhodopirellula heiligendammensis]|uniref:Uncharacterized protein n=1 Tax=Allorhodopirellula heiligendammensis TaxID=2714739 RepID=A0A5C6C721_9BACT|nr:hypothetical protein Poly21_20640 [Allorhodopirellula heiligendammensis]
MFRVPRECVAACDCEMVNLPRMHQPSRRLTPWGMIVIGTVASFNLHLRHGIDELRHEEHQKY